MATKQEITDALNALKSEVQSQTTTIASVRTMIAGLVDQLHGSVATATDLDAFKAEIAEIASQLQTNDADLAAAAASPPTLGAGTAPASPPAP